MSDVQDYDVVIIGAGINGAGLFRDLCEQGLRCLIIDKGDFGSGTSAAPSRLIHGGLKYLETGEFGLVAQSTLERNLLLRNAPHLVHPLPTVIPIYSWTKGIWAALRTFFGSTTAPRSRGAVLIKIGLRMYDFYGSRSRVMPRHKMITRARALRDIPALTPRIKAVGTYYDAAITGAERLVLELVQDGLTARPGSKALNWADLQSCHQGVLTITASDGSTLRARPRIVVNAAGPWIDSVNALLGEPTKLIGGTKGSHILIDHPELLRQLDGRMIYFEGDDGRILLVYPYLGKAMVGSTDIPAQDPDTVLCDDDEIAYFMQSLRDLLPGLSFSTDQIVYTYAGIRPLPNSQGVDPGLISRDHSTPELPTTTTRPFPVLSLVGGKWTTFRGFAEEVADGLLQRLGKPRKVSTRDLPIGGGKGIPHAHARQAWITDTGAPERAKVLLARYGTTARQIIAQEGPKPVLVTGTQDTSRAEIDWIARNEMVVHLEDIVLRRTQLALTGQITRAGLDDICAVAAAALGWDAQRIAEEVQRAAKLLAARHGVKL
ncbi:FAD-dependent oxidoreductase [Primorskyibacter sp. 2E233]|uniref:glycerol-3-phosphate dehydrogenase/oxidase n=1 Tax=Primorskyibacter sp. 2E233 TaxID=3413431 RepID=UPI003BF13B05